jgi:molecular chaperone GrpE
MTQGPPRGGNADDDPERPRIRVHDRRLERRDEASGDPEPTPASPPAPASPNELAEALDLAADRLDQLKRLKADFENYRKRVIREQTELVERASLRIVERLLPVVDDLERALRAAREHDPGEAIVRGLELVHQHLHEVLVDEGLERVEAEGAFDPQHHEAVSSVPGDVVEPTILEVVRPGYKLKGRTIRPALVHVSVPELTAAPELEEGG